MILSNEIIHDLSDLSGFARRMCKYIHLPSIFLLSGEVGSGKTTLVRFFCDELKVTERVKSPGFNLLNLYNGYLNKKKVIIYHFDFYRLKQEKNPRIHEFIDLGAEINFISFMEWPEIVSSNWRESFTKWQSRLIFIKFNMDYEKGHRSLEWEIQNEN